MLNILCGVIIFTISLYPVFCSIKSKKKFTKCGKGYIILIIAGLLATIWLSFGSDVESIIVGSNLII